MRSPPHDDPNDRRSPGVAARGSRPAGGSARSSARGLRCAVALPVLAAAGAAACATGGRGARAHPGALAALWVDVGYTAASDSTFWRLTPDGAFRPFRRRVDAFGRVASDERFAPAHSDWYVRGPVGDSAARRLCVHNSRTAAYCAAFTLDTLADGTRRLRLHEHRKPFVVPARTLVAPP